MAAVGKLALERRGNRWIHAGGALGVAGAAVAILAPLALVEIARYAPGGIAGASSTLIAWTSWLVLAGAALLFLSFFAYRWAYSVLRKADRGYWIASGLCIVGSSGMLLLILAAALATGSQSGLLSCVQGPYSHLYSCVQGQTPLGAYTGIVGVWLGWLGGVGIVAGLFRAGNRYSTALYTAAAALYVLALLVLVGPLAGPFLTIPRVELLFVLVPVFTVVAPILVLASRPIYATRPETPATVHPR